MDSLLALVFRNRNYSRSPPPFSLNRFKHFATNPTRVTNEILKSVRTFPVSHIISFNFYCVQTGQRDEKTRLVRPLVSVFRLERGLLDLESFIPIVVTLQGGLHN